MKRKQKRWVLGLLLVLAAMLVGCGRGADGAWALYSTETERRNDMQTEFETTSDNAMGTTGLDTLPDGTITPESSEMQRARQIMEGLSPEEKVGQLFMTFPEALTSGGTVTAFHEDTLCVPLGGVIFFGANIKNPTQCRELIANLQSASSLPLFIAVDEEGGRVARVSGNEAMGCEVFPPMGELRGTNEAYRAGNVLGKQLKELGFNLDFAPVADVNSNPNNPVIGTRAFGSDPDTVAQMVCAAMRGFHDSGMLCTLKHFPGHGDTEADSHHAYTEVNKTLTQLWQTELIPFQAGSDAGADFVMVGHIALPEVTGNDLPATISPQIISILREEIGFEGVIVTDSMRMKALSDRYSCEESAILALAAGVDVILMPSDLERAYRGVLEAVESGRLSEERIEESVMRVLCAKVRAGIVE